LALPFTSVALFSGVVLISGALTVGGLNFTADTVARVAAETPIQARMKPSYVARLPVAKPEALNVAKAVPVAPATLSVQAKAPEPVVAPPIPKFTHKVAVDAARVRSGPKKGSPHVFTLKNGSWVTVSENVKGWMHVKDEQGREGWVHSSLLRESTPPPQAAGTLAQAQ